MPTPDEHILEEIDKNRPACFSSDRLRPTDFARLLEIVLSAHPSFRPLNLGECDDLIAKDPTLGPALSDAYTSESFSKLIAHPSIVTFRRSTPGMVIGSVQLAKSSSNGSSSLKAAFEADYQGNGYQHFIKVLSDSSQVPSLYNKSISIIQSSGMGKSRLVQEAANEVFTIPANLREDLNLGLKAYPPPDKELRSYFEDHEFKSDELLQAEYAILLKHMFHTARNEISKEGGKLKGLSGAKLAKDWSDYLNAGQDDKTVGENRVNFYKQVVQAARKEISDISDMVWVDPIKLCVVSPSVQDSSGEASKTSKFSNQVKHQPHLALKEPDGLEKLFVDMFWSASKMLKVVEPGYSPSKNACFVPFDESHKLTKSPQAIIGFRSRSPYHNLGTVLSKLCHLPIFFIFLSTNSHLQQFAPSVSHHPSARVSNGSKLVAPFTELPFDVFMKEMFEELDGSKRARSLVNACTTDVMSSMGRPLWFAHHKQWLGKGPGQQNSDGRTAHVLVFAYLKLTAQDAKEHVPQSRLAALSIRVGVKFDSTTHASREAESQQVESHMRVVYAIPEHWEYMRTGSSSEPVLAEAAAQYLNQVLGNADIATMGPQILLENCQNGFLARGERGELCGRLLMTIAHDIAVKETRLEMDKLLKDPEVRFHRPVHVPAFLRALFADTHHATVLQATPVTDEEGDTLEFAFQNAYVCFSHFALAADSDMLDASALRMALFRGMAIQANDNQASIDAVIPIHMGPITNPIRTETTSAINLQFKNRKSITGISPRTRNQAGKFEPHPDDRHYSFVARGCRSATYKAIPKITEGSYRAILASGGLRDDFPRNDEDSWALVEDLKPSFIAAKCQAEWHRWDRLDSEVPSISIPPSIEWMDVPKKRSQSADLGCSKAAGRKRN
ncbi:hypothetical protein OPQ81_002258 [Rhizoctonia solani]|nr:hypothetical protein OPQ81_002258 [Rhizoctonia solani]